jgi:hypothetical protein
MEDNKSRTPLQEILDFFLTPQPDGNDPKDREEARLLRAAGGVNCPFAGYACRQSHFWKRRIRPGQ